MLMVMIDRIGYEIGLDSGIVSREVDYALGGRVLPPGSLGSSNRALSRARKGGRWQLSAFSSGASAPRENIALRKHRERWKVFDMVNSQCIPLCIPSG